VATLADQFGCSQLLLNDHVGPLTPEGAISGEAQLAAAQSASVAAASVDASDVVLGAFLQVADAHVVHDRHRLHLGATPAAAPERHRRTFFAAHCAPIQTHTHTHDTLSRSIKSNQIQSNPI